MSCRIVKRQVIPAGNKIVQLYIKRIVYYRIWIEPDCGVTCSYINVDDFCIVNTAVFVDRLYAIEIISRNRLTI